MTRESDDSKQTRESSEYQSTETFTSVKKEKSSFRSIDKLTTFQKFPNVTSSCHQRKSDTVEVDDNREKQIFFELTQVMDQGEKRVINCLNIKATDMSVRTQKKLKEKKNKRKGNNTPAV